MFHEETVDIVDGDLVLLLGELEEGMVTDVRVYALLNIGNHILHELQLLFVGSFAFEGHPEPHLHYRGGGAASSKKDLLVVE